MNVEFPNPNYERIEMNRVEQGGMYLMYETADGTPMKSGSYWAEFNEKGLVALWKFKKSADETIGGKG